jgi:all-trans-8'-apo-beta-carotenal 15,15'-oxygenase
VDTETGKTESYDFGEGVYCSEPGFAPQPGFPYSPVASEEPGWLLTEIYSDLTNKSALAILRADQIADGPVAIAHLHHHAPFSFHGFWEG